MTQIKIIPMEMEHLPLVRAFADKWIGKNYFDRHELTQIYNMSLKDGLNSSFCAFDGDKLAGIRLTLAPGNWQTSFSPKDLSPDLWGIPASTVGYFKSLFVHGDYQRQGLGRELSRYSLDVLRLMGAHGVLCHSWLESPGNSSQGYLQKMGFHSIKEHPMFWYEIDYLCTRCTPERCRCTAMEMLYLF